MHKLPKILQRNQGSFFRCTHSQQVANYGYQGGIRLRLQRLIVLYKIADKHFTALIITSSEQCGHIYRIQVPIPMSTLAALVTKIHTFFYKKPRERGSPKSFLKIWSFLGLKVSQRFLNFLCLLLQTSQIYLSCLFEMKFL